MKLGTQTGSLINHLIADYGTTDIKVGETGATVLSWSDRHACTVVGHFKKGKFTYITVREDHAKRIDSNGMSDAQDYEYSPNEYGQLYTFKLTKDGYKNVRLNENGRYVLTGVYGLCVGRREEFHDFSF